MAAVASPVAVVTGMGSRRLHGTTVSAFVSVSLTPPMVLVSLENQSLRSQCPGLAPGERVASSCTVPQVTDQRSATTHHAVCVSSVSKGAVRPEASS